MFLVVRNCHWRFQTCWSFLSLLGIVFVCSGLEAEEPQPTDHRRLLQFNRDIRPILSDSCFQCHGPDSKNRKGDLRFDQDDTLTTGPADKRLVVPGKPAESEFFRRLTTDDPEEKMPPPAHVRPLSAEQINLLRRWIEQGAVWEKHWSLIAPVHPEVPSVKRTDWPRNPIDSFILSRLESEELSPTAEADRRRLLRRVSLDLTGLPPTLAEVEAFELDTAPDAYERVVDRLLASPRYGERMAIRWLDAARYADTNGYQTDGPRDMYRWRDWVITAYNTNLPFDQFTIEQLAGDLLPHPSRDQIIATGFNRNHRTNSEGGVIGEEFLAEYAADRVETTCTVWMGLTMSCSRCHDHKYDPLTQRDYYQMFAFFNNIPERGKTLKVGNTPPMTKAPTSEQEAKLAQLDQQVQIAADLIQQKRPEWSLDLQKWVDQAETHSETEWFPDDELEFSAGFDQSLKLVESSAKSTAPSYQGNVEETPSVVKETAPQYATGVMKEALVLDGNGAIPLGDRAAFDYLDKFSFSFWIRFPPEAHGTILARAKDNDDVSGISLVLTPEHKIQLNFVNRWLDDAIRVESEQPLVPNEWQHVVVIYDATRFATGIHCYINGEKRPLKTLLDELLQTFKIQEPLRLGFTHSSSPPLKGELDELRSYGKILSLEEIQILGVPENINTIARIPAPERTPPQTLKLEHWFLQNQAGESTRQAWANLRDLRKQQEKMRDSIPSVMTMVENPTPKETFLLLRGQYDNPGDRVARGVPASLPGLDSTQLPNRLDLARWLVSPQHPLTARVAVNRFWQMYFGQGIVKTVDDFGSQGEWPTHPELLDWLATEFIASGWNVKQMQRLIVTSATYRQNSQIHPAQHQRDPENRWLSRGPRTRLPAEMIRDQALLASGLLVEEVGGPSVLPYQPPGLWKELNGVADYPTDKGSKLYRRSLYTYWKRTAPPPFMMNFDTAGRETCFVRESRTNTPLQALNLLNDVIFIESARQLSQSLLQRSDLDDTARLDLAFQRILIRKPLPHEMELLQNDLAAQRQFFQAAPDAANQLLTVGDSPRDEKISPVEMASYTMVANLLFNLDEFISKQ